MQEEEEVVVEKSKATAAVTTRPAAREASADARWPELAVYAAWLLGAILILTPRLAAHLDSVCTTPACRAGLAPSPWSDRPVRTHPPLATCTWGAWTCA
jgi:hypothetical protein